MEKESVLQKMCFLLNYYRFMVACLYFSKSKSFVKVTILERPLDNEFACFHNFSAHDHFV